MEWLAHSADLQKGIGAQLYARHLAGVQRLAVLALGALHGYCPDEAAFTAAVRLAAEWHDLGKLEELNQEVLSGRKNIRPLPVSHMDAGTAKLLQDGLPLAATLVRAHHAPGLPDFPTETIRGSHCLRDERIQQQTDAHLPHLVARHSQAFTRSAGNAHRAPPTATPGLFLRMALSVLVHADHTDTAMHYAGTNAAAHFNQAPPLQPAERLRALDGFVSQLGEAQGDRHRQQLRQSLYHACQAANYPDSIVACDSPVGSGKTTAVMANLLAQAQRRNLRRIFIVLPFTNIIAQSVKVYRRALVLPGEDPTQVVAEVHHRVDYADYRSREYATLWNAPIVVTTAVAFFETMASCQPGALRRLHQVPGSAVFMDEAHAALPPHLLPLAWQWMKCLSDEWSCYWVLASGSLQQFWKIPEIDAVGRHVPDLVGQELHEQSQVYEQQRVTYGYHPVPLQLPELLTQVRAAPGPRLLILNTVQSAAAVARYFRQQGQSVEHISTSLTPYDREITLKTVEKRLANSQDDDWTLVGTSCIEAGLDFSFRSGFRELASLTSLLQAAGRINREGKWPNTPMYSFRLAQTHLLHDHPGFQAAADILHDFFARERRISPELCTEAMTREILAHTTPPDQNLCSAENNLRFPHVDEHFRVIAADTRTVVIDSSLIQKLEAFEPVAWQEIQRHSVQIWGTRLTRLHIPEIRGHPDIYRWSLEYDSFLGYMKGMLEALDVEAQRGGIF